MRAEENLWHPVGLPLGGARFNISFIFYPYEAPPGAGLALRANASKDACATK